MEQAKPEPKWWMGFVWLGIGVFLGVFTPLGGMAWDVIASFVRVLWAAFLRGGAA